MESSSSTLEDSKNSSSSYGQILKSSSIIGGAQGLNYLVGMVRTKAVAMLLGPSGVGLVGIYLSITGLISTFSSLGVGSSGVREIAEAAGENDELRMAATATTLRRVCWVTGILGWILSASLAWPLSQWAFQSGQHAWAISLLGITVLVGSVSSGQTALLQGVRRIGDLARIQVVAMVLSTVVTLGLYAGLKERGIIPVLLATAFVNLGISWYFAKKVNICVAPQSWRETVQRSKQLLALGLAFMWSGLLTAGVALVIRSVIVRQLGLDANGIYQAAWGLSGMFAGFILGAMGADFYPRLTAAASDHHEVNRLVNEQTEIGILLALPGLLGTMVFAPWLMHLFYSKAFLQGGDLLPWFVLGIFGQVISWPLGFIFLAKGEKTWFAVVETAAGLLKLGVAVGLLYWIGLVGTAVAYPVLYSIHIVGMFAIVRKLTGFSWSPGVKRLLSGASFLTVSGFGASFLSSTLGLVVGAVLTILAGIYSLRGLSERLGRDNRLIKAAMRVPGARIIIA